MISTNWAKVDVITILLTQRLQADEVLENTVWEHVKPKDAGCGEKAAAWSATTAMKVKRQTGSRCNTRIRSGNISFRQNILLPILKSLQ